MDECSVVAMECTPDRDLPLIQIPVAKMKRSIPLYTKSSRCSVGLTMSFHIQTGEFLHCNNHWFTISSVGVGHDGQPTVKVFDSMYDSVQSSNCLSSLHFRRFN